MQIIVELSHPKHYYQFRILVKKLEKSGDRIIYLVRGKDILIRILDEMDEEYVLLNKVKMSIFGRMFFFPLVFFKYITICYNFRPDLLISKASPYAVIAGRLLGFKNLIFPDSEVVRLTRWFVAPLANLIITPRSFSLDFGEKHRKVPGLFENCYLDPMNFEPDASFLEASNIKEPFVLMRFVSWKASHDINRAGLDDREKERLIKALKKTCNIYISSEKPLPAVYKMYEINASLSHIHHILYFASLYFGDSQTMATEAALLGTPSIRINSFVGEDDMSNFKMLEKEYELVLNFNDFEEALKAARKILENPDSKLDWAMKRKKYFNDSGDVNTACMEIIKSYKNI